jgi:adenylosuccinate synthase
MEAFAEKLKMNLEEKNAMFTKIYGEEALDYDTILNEYKLYAEELKHRIIDSVPEVNKALDENKFVLFEGAQAMMLDIDYGTYPYVTSSSPTAGGVTTGAGVGPRKIDKIIGVMKAYTTRVGEGPFVTELDNELGETLRTTGGEYGATTGRPRRCGWLDVVVGKYAVAINGLTDVVMTKIDVLSGHETLKICTGYEIEGEITDTPPASIERLEKAKPVYIEVPGWTEDISAIRNYDELPSNCKAYIKKVEELIGAPISMVSVGPDREQNIFINQI